MRNPASHGIDTDEFPNAKAWAARIAARPAAVEAVKEGEAMRTTNVLSSGRRRGGEGPCAAVRPKGPEIAGARIAGAQWPHPPTRLLV